MIQVVFNIDNDDFFNGCLSVPSSWNLPHLPRIGETIHPLLIIEQKNFNWKKVYSIIQDKWKQNFEEYYVSFGEKDREKSFKYWFLDCMCEYNTITSIRYNPASENNLEILPYITMQ